MDITEKKVSDDEWQLINRSMEVLAYLQPIKSEDISQINPIYIDALADLAEKRYVIIHDGRVELTVFGEVKFFELLELMLERNML